MRGILSEHRQGAGVVRSFDPGSVTRGTACLASVCVQAVLKDATWGWAPQAVKDSRRGFNGARDGLRGSWSKSADWETARRTIICRKVRQSTARIDRTARMVLISRDYVRAVVYPAIRRRR